VGFAPHQNTLLTANGYCLNQTIGASIEMLLANRFATKGFDGLNVASQAIWTLFRADNWYI
jgi:hypothetical protein